MVDVRVRNLSEALFEGIDNCKELRRAYYRFVDDVHDTWVNIWRTDSQGVIGNHPYADGTYEASIQKKMPKKYQRIKKFLADGLPIGMVYSDDHKAHWIEYGTDADAPGGHATWIGLDGERHWGPDTPTPEFMPMRKTALRFM